MPPDRKRPITFFIFTSILLHIVLLFFLQWVVHSLQNRAAIPRPMWVELKKLEPEKLPRQIADIPQPAQESVPEKPSAQALYSQRVADEMTNPRMGPPSKAGSPKPSPSPPAEKKGDEKGKSLSELYAMREEAKREGRAIPPAERGLGETQNLDDFLPGFKVGDRTYINTLANPNIRYFVELKRKFRLTFNPVPALRSTANIVARGQIDVVVGVSIDGNGNLADLVVIRSSGMDNYDREGLRTVRASSPFTAPPANLLGNDGMLHMAWTFIVYL